jgi:hypothetical protein
MDVLEGDTDRVMVNDASSPRRLGRSEGDTDRVKVNDGSSPWLSGRSPCPNRMYGADSGFVGFTQTETRRTNGRKIASTTAIQPVPDKLTSTTLPVADAVPKKGCVHQILDILQNSNTY